ncbi:unnamed protein product [Adineta ricciae]|uniref:Uncharacterized protein n=1 Tax=Adineta ricciae TaxID=249248 RepID=A0A816E0Y3_ADIRI|nr:unnamed protein product [Adineta ricciae]
MAEEDDENNDFELEHCLTSENLVTEPNMQSASNLGVTKILKANRNSKPSQKCKANRNSQPSQKCKPNRNSKPSRKQKANRTSKPSQKRKANRNSKPSRKRKANRYSKMSNTNYKEKNAQVSESDEMNEHVKVLKKSIQNRNERSLCEQEDAYWLTDTGYTEENLEAETIYNVLNERYFSTILQRWLACSCCRSLNPESQFERATHKHIMQHDVKEGDLLCKKCIRFIASEDRPYCLFGRSKNKLEICTIPDELNLGFMEQRAISLSHVL